MDLDLVYLLLAIAAAAGALITLLGMGYFRTQVEGHAEAPQGEAAPEGVPRQVSKGRPGGGPSVAWFVRGGGRLGEIRYKRYKKAVQAVAEDLAGSGRLEIEVGLAREGLDRIRNLPWGPEEAQFLVDPADAFFIMLDRPLKRFDPRYDRYVIVPLGFMEGAGGVESFLGVLAYQVLAEEADPMDAAETLLRDAAEVAVAAGFAPPDVLRALVEMLRRQVFSGRYRPFLGNPGTVPGQPVSGSGPASAPPPRREAAGGGAAAAGGEPTLEEGLPEVPPRPVAPPAPPPGIGPAAAQPPPRAKPPRKPED